ncbi:MAG: SLC13 family permease [Sulfuritalea sp.]|nr:SLC13 family permease [Sulfuritalea sp.]
MKKISPKIVIAAIVFLLVWVAAASVAPSAPVTLVLGILLLTVFLFAFEVVGVDVAAVSILVLLGLISTFGVKFGLAKPLVPNSELFSGFSSNAVMSIIAVMIIGAGLDKTGLMGKVAGTILKYAGRTEARVIPAISGSVGFISSFMQNVGAAALFLPVVSRISARTGLAMSRLLMPMGFCAILGGTITMVGSSPLILLNDLILASNKALPAAQQMQTWSLFSVTPVGLALLSTGIAYFVIAGRFVLPGSARDDMTSGTDAMDYYRNLYGLDYALYEVAVPAGSPLIGTAVNEIEQPFRLRVIAMLRGADDLRVGPGGVSRDVTIEAGCVLGLLGAPERLREFAAKFSLDLREELVAFADTLAPTKAGIAEVVIPPGSSLIGKSARDVWMRKVYGLALVALHRGGKTLREGDGVRDMPLQAGDAMVVHTTWDALAHLETNRDFVIITTEYPHEELRPH